MSGACLIFCPDEQNPSSTLLYLEQVNPEQQSESDTQTNPEKEKHKNRNMLQIRCKNGID